MPYITIPIQPKTHQLSFDEVMFSTTGDNISFNKYANTFDTRTVYREDVPKSLLDKLDVAALVNVLKKFNTAHLSLYEVKDKSTLYHSFKIPKRTGGFRPIDAPLPPLMTALKELKYIFEIYFYGKMYHTAAFAYVKKRSILMAVQRHQMNKSRWFLKLDLHNFFGSNNLDFDIKMLSMIFPFSEVIKYPDGEAELRKALSLAYLDGKLPQGTPISPLITNLVMIPIDHAISKIMRENTPYIVYTRYADDMTFSAISSFEDKGVIWNLSQISEKIDKLKESSSDMNLDELIKKRDNLLSQTTIVSKVVDILSRAGAPFEINAKKTHYGNSNGRNWILGIMLNKDNEITLGHERKNELKIDIYNFMKDFAKGKPWSLLEAQELRGKISYHLQIEKDVTNKILLNYTNKFHRNVVETIENIIKGK